MLPNYQTHGGKISLLRHFEQRHKNISLGRMQRDGLTKRLREQRRFVDTHTEMHSEKEKVNHWALLPSLLIWQVSAMRKGCGGSAPLHATFSGAIWTSTRRNKDVVCCVCVRLSVYLWYVCSNFLWSVLSRKMKVKGSSPAPLLVCLLSFVSTFSDNLSQIKPERKSEKHWEEKRKRKKDWAREGVKKWDGRVRREKLSVSTFVGSWRSDVSQSVSQWGVWRKSSDGRRSKKRNRGNNKEEKKHEQE